jgi:cytochrome c2
VLIPLLTSLAGEASALELPVPEKLEREYGVQRQTIEVVEPHASTPDQPKRVRYVALPLDGLLRRWFDASWQAPDAEIVFLARDGYRSTIPGSRLMNHRAYLAFARVDGNAFVVDNLEQNEKGVPLGPYYLIWDNRSAPDLLPLGSSGWPYQVTRIELHSAAEDRRLLPTSPSPDIISGFEDTKEHCLNCHRIRGVGGEKYAEDLVRAACRWHDNDLKSWIGDPRQFRPATAMPPLNPQLPAEARRELIERIAAYLVAVKADDPAACAGASVKP